MIFFKTRNAIYSPVSKLFFLFSAHAGSLPVHATACYTNRIDCRGHGGVFSTRADEKALEMAKTGKVIMVVVVMHLYGNTKSNSITTSAKNSAKKTKLGSNSKKLGLNQSKKQLKEAQLPQEDASERLVVKHTTIRVLLDTGSSGDLFS
jgi:hypothetical protein